MFGSSPFLPLSVLSEQSGKKLKQIIDSEEWYSVLRDCVTRLGEGKEAIDDVMWKNARSVYNLTE